ncbi:MAG: histidine phosphatase family protein [Bdellovibrionales bacterium]|nr:histidine phosphatase family protein [Bdellovibrionales bacterium]
MTSAALLPIYAFRHGQTDWNKEGRIQGHLDVPLNDVGRAEGLRLARALRRVPIRLILSSDLSRAVDTATITLAEAIRNAWHPDVPILRDARLREVSLGQLQGLTHSEIHAKFGANLSRKIGTKILSDEELRDLGSESVDDLLGRLMAAIEEVSSHPELLAPGAALALSTHGGVLRRLLHSAGGIEEIGFSIPNAVFFPFAFDRATKRLVFRDFVPFV